MHGGMEKELSKCGQGGLLALPRPVAGGLLGSCVGVRGTVWERVRVSQCVGGR